MAKRPASSAQITVRLTPETKLKITSIADRLGVSDGEAIRQMVEHSTAEFERRAEEVARIRGEGQPSEEEIVAEMAELAENMRAGVPLELSPGDVNGLRGKALSRLLLSLWEESPEPPPESNNKKPRKK